MKRRDGQENFHPVDFDVKYNFDYIEDQPRRYYRRVFEEKAGNIVGWDTETFNDKVGLIANSDGEYLLKPSPFKLLSFLTRPEYHKTINLFYNIRYDAQAIIKSLDFDNLDGFYYLNRQRLGDYEIRYIPGKLLGIKYKNRVYKYYDLYQFYKMSLNKAAKMFLGESKLDYDVTNLHVSDFREDNFDLIRYCIQDCVLVKKLGDLFKSKLERINIDFVNPISPASLAERYMLKNCRLPYFYKNNIQKYAYYAYYGGRFELLKRGYFSDVFVYDINSAYPYEISLLPDLKETTFYHTYEFESKADLGFYLIKVYSVDCDYVSPIVYPLNGINVYPNVKGIYKFVSQSELSYISSLKDVDFDVVDGWVGYCDSDFRPFEFVRDLYEYRKEIEDDDPKLGYIIKLFLNSIYGKFAQINKKYKVVDEVVKELLIEGEGLLTEDALVKVRQPGLLFNPVYASTITSNVRVKLLDTCRGFVDDVVAFHTDSIILLKDRIKSSDKLGGWSFEGEGEGVFLQTGIYTIRSEDEVLKNRRRGIAVKSIDLFSLLSEYSDRDKIPYRFYTNVTIPMLLKQSNRFSLSDLNSIYSVERVIDVVNEKKRDWLDVPSCAYDLLENSYDSRPLCL